MSWQDIVKEDEEHDMPSIDADGMLSGITDIDDAMLVIRDILKHTNAKVNTGKYALQYASGLFDKAVEVPTKLMREIESYLRTEE